MPLPVGMIVHSGVPQQVSSTFSTVSVAGCVRSVHVEDPRLTRYYLHAV